MNHNFHEEEVLGKAYDSRLMKRLLSYLKPYTLQVVLAVGILFCASLMQLAGPFLTKLAIDNYIINHDVKGLNYICLIFLAVLFVGFFLEFLQTYMIHWIGQKAMFDLRTQLFSHLQKLSIRFFDRNPVGRLVTRVTNDVESLHQMLSSGVVSIFGDIFKLIGIVVVLLGLNWQLALVTFSVLPFLFYATFLFKKLVRGSYRLIRIRIARINAFLQENITGMSIVQIFNREKKNFHKFDKLNQDHLQVFLKTVFYYSIFFPSVRVVSAVAIALIVWFGGGQILQGVLKFGTLVAFIQYAEMFFRPIMDLSEKYNIMQSAMASSERIFGLMDISPEIQSLEKTTDGRVVHGEIEFKNVWFAYQGDDYVLKDVSFHVAPGERVAFVGATGAGKTTIMNLLLRFYEVNQGGVYLDGVNVKEMDQRQLRSYFSIVLQDIFIFDGSIADNIRLGDQSISDAKLREVTSEVHVDSFIRKLSNGFDHPVQERGRALSVGQRQLLAFARAMAFDPAVLILDEATSSVDTETEMLIQDALERLMQNRTSLVVAHRLSTVQNADRIIVMHKGRIHEQGNHRELLVQKGLYYQLYQLQYASQEKEPWAA
ncbi:MAG: ABC transporter ATP-binding protein [bacterium]